MIYDCVYIISQYSSTRTFGKLNLVSNKYWIPNLSSIAHRINFYQASTLGDRVLVDYCINKGALPRANKWNWGMHFAAEGGHVELVKFFIDKGASDWNRGMHFAAEGGHIELVKFFISKGANDWKWGMYSAEEGGHKEIVNFFKQKLNSN